MEWWGPYALDYINSKILPGNRGESPNCKPYGNNWSIDIQWQILMTLTTKKTQQNNFVFMINPIIFLDLHNSSQKLCQNVTFLRQTKTGAASEFGGESDWVRQTFDRFYIMCAQYWFVKFWRTWDKKIWASLGFI